MCHMLVFNSSSLGRLSCCEYFSFGISTFNITHLKSSAKDSYVQKIFFVMLGLKCMMRMPLAKTPPPCTTLSAFKMTSIYNSLPSETQSLLEIIQYLPISRIIISSTFTGFLSILFMCACLTA